MATPKAGWTHTLDMVDWAEEVASFLTREKTKFANIANDTLADPAELILAALKWS